MNLGPLSKRSASSFPRSSIVFCNDRTTLFVGSDMSRSMASRALAVKIIKHIKCAFRVTVFEGIAHISCLQ